MHVSRLTAVIVLLLAVAGGVYMWIDMRSSRQALADIRDQMERMTSRMDLVTEVVESASARAIRAEENAFAAAEARDRAEQLSADAQAQAELSAEEARAAREEAEAIRLERQQDLERLEEALGSLVETRRTAMGLVMNLGSDAVQFDFDQATLRPENRELLSRIAGILLTARGYSIYVYGHTDDVGTEEYNRDLSERRARTVRDYLVDAGVDPVSISTRGYGKSSPRVAGTSVEARAENRRVEIGIVDVSMDYRGSSRD